MHTARAYTYPDGTVVYRIGYYDPSPRMDNWRILGEISDFADALDWVSFLNGGSKPTGQGPKASKVKSEL